MVQWIVGMPIAAVKFRKSTSSPPRCILRTSVAAARGKPLSEIRGGCSCFKESALSYPISASVSATAGPIRDLAIASAAVSRSITSHSAWQSASRRVLPDARPLVLE
jgi:hypothetical protein